MQIAMRTIANSDGWIPAGSCYRQVNHPETKRLINEFARKILDQSKRISQLQRTTSVYTVREHRLASTNKIALTTLC